MSGRPTLASLQRELVSLRALVEEKVHNGWVESVDALPQPERVLVSLLGVRDLGCMIEVLPLVGLSPQEVPYRAAYMTAGRLVGLRPAPMQNDRRAQPPRTRYVVLQQGSEQTALLLPLSHEVEVLR